MSVAYTMAATRAMETEAASAAETSVTRMVPLTSAFTRGVEPPLVVLRNSGGKPLRLHAELVAEGSSRCTGSALWHELALYRTSEGTIAVAIRFLAASGMEAGVHRARLFDTADEVASWLENFDPAFDLGADFDVSDARESVASVSLKAAALRDRAERLSRAYRVMIGEVLYRLETES
jgi:hypothetical protein